MPLLTLRPPASLVPRDWVLTSPAGGADKPEEVGSHAPRAVLNFPIGLGVFSVFLKGSQLGESQIVHMNHLLPNWAFLGLASLPALLPYSYSGILGSDLKYLVCVLMC